MSLRYLLPIYLLVYFSGILLAIVRSGVFKISGNPIFGGMIVALLGLFSIIPNVITLITFLVGLILVGIQVPLEEEYLTSTHGDTYIEYRRNVRRWI